jgi:hypothetical protein
VLSARAYLSRDKSCEHLVFQTTAHDGEGQYGAFDGTVLQIPNTLRFGSHARCRVDVHVFLDGAVKFFYKTKRSQSSTQRQRTR